MAADPDFAKMDIGEQRKALAAHDPDFAKMADSDITSFVSAHQGIETPDAVAQSRAALASKVQPTPTLGDMVNRQVPRPPGSGEEAMLATGAPPAAEALSAIGTAGQLKADPVGTLRALLKGAVGSATMAYAGGHAGRYLAGKGTLINPDTAENIGKVGGALIGGLGGGLGMGEKPEPEVFPVSKSPGPYRGPKSVPKPVAPEPELGSPDNPGWMSKLPTRMPKPAPTPWAEAQSAPGVPGSLPKPSGRLVVLPEEAQSLDQMSKIATKRAKDNGMFYAAGMRPAGGGRVPLTPTRTNTAEINATKPGKSPLPWETQATNATPPPLQVSNAMGIRWASDGVNKVSIPDSLTDEEIEAYARPKLAEQASIRSQLPWMKGNQ